MPKWTNKGHEFDELGKIFIKNKNITLIGSEEDCECFKKKLDFLQVPVTCVNSFPTFKNAKGLKKYINKIKYHFRKKYFFYRLSNRQTIVVLNSRAEYLNMLFKAGYTKNKNIFSQEEFLNKYLSIYSLYLKDKVYFPSNSFICTTVCTLNCKECLNYAPYDKHKVHYDIERLKKDVDIYFNCVDRVGLFHISGGEPFSYPHIKELIEYIGTNYRDKIETLAVVTNMTIFPSDELCQVLVKHNVLVQLDNYTETNPDRKVMYDKVLEKLRTFNVNLDEIVAGTQWNWVSTFPPREVTLDKNSLIKKYDCCGSIFQELKNGKLFGCCYCEFIAQAGVFDYKEDDYFDLEKFNSDKKKELVEFRLKYNDKGYVEFCKYCNGLPPYNKEFIQPAVQTVGLYDWDINNPTEVKQLV